MRFPFANKHGTVNMRSAEVIEVIHVTTYEGEGTAENVGRLVDYYFDKTGRMLAFRDIASEDSWQQDGSTGVSGDNQGPGK